MSNIIEIFNNKIENYDHIDDDKFSVTRLQKIL